MNRREEFENQLRAVLDALYGTALHLAENAADAEDLVQEAALKALIRYGTFRAGTDFKAWIVRILANSFIDGCRRRKRWRAIEEGGELARSPEDGVRHQDLEFLLADDVARAVRVLAPEQRLAMMLVDVNDLSNAEAAEAIGCPLGTLNSRLARGRTALREALRRAADANRDVQRVRDKT